MKIVIDCRMAHKSGIGTVTQSILENLPKYHDYTLIGESSDKYLNSFGYEIIDCDIPIFSLKELFFFPVSQINNFDAFLSINWNVPLGIKIPVYSFIHDVIYLDVKGLLNPISRAVRYFYMLYTVLKSEKIFTVSEFSKNRIIQHYKCTEKVVVSYIDVNKKLKAYASSNLYLKKTEDYFIFVGNVKPHKGIQLLIDAFLRQSSALKLYIVGEQNNFLTGLSIDIEKYKNIKFTGKISDEELYQLLMYAKALVLPSVDEGFALPPLEALWLNTPVIISDIPVFKEVYSDFPVLFFKNKDVDDLAQKLTQVRSIEFDRNLLNRFNAKNMVTVVFNTIRN